MILVMCVCFKHLHVFYILYSSTGSGKYSIAVLPVGPSVQLYHNFKGYRDRPK